MISTPCPRCGKMFETEDTLAGRAAECSACAAAQAASAEGAADPSVDKAAPLAPDEQSCPRCSERIKKGALLCRFCRTKLADPVSPVFVPIRTSPPVAPGRAEGRPPRRRRSTAAVVWTIVGIVVLLGILGIGGLTYMMMGQRGPFDDLFREMCRDNLTQLYGGVEKYKKETGGLPKETGSRFWKTIASRTRLKDELHCAAAVFSNLGQDDVAYRGPAAAWDEIDEGGIVACDRSKSHKKGITVLFKDGRVEFARAGTELYQRALRETVE